MEQQIDFIKPNESYTETIAILLYIIFLTDPFNPDTFLKNLKKEMLFSLYQTAKLFNYEKITSGEAIRKVSRKKILFRQEVANFEYYYLKLKLLYNLNNLFKFNYNYSPEKSPLLKLKFPKGYYIEFSKLLCDIDENLDNSLTEIMSHHPKDKTILLNILNFT